MKKTPVRVSRSSNRAAVGRTLNHWRHHPPLRTAGTVALALVVVVVSTVYLQFHGEFTPAMHLTLVSDRAGLVMEPGGAKKVTYNASKSAGSPRCARSSKMTPPRRNCPWTSLQSTSS